MTFIHYLFWNKAQHKLSVIIMKGISSLDEEQVARLDVRRAGEDLPTSKNPLQAKLRLLCFHFRVVGRVLPPPSAWALSLLRSLAPSAQLCLKAPI